MPNYVINQLHMTGEQSRIDELLKAVKGDESVIDFNKIIPMPDSLNVTEGSESHRAVSAYLSAVNPITADYGFPKISAEDFKLIFEKFQKAYFLKIEDTTQKCVDVSLAKLGKTYVDNLVQYGAPSWYHWCVNNWGTKWNAGSTEILDENTVQFDTAWSRVMPIVQKLAETYPDITFEYRWADEDIGVNVGTAKFEKGELTEDSPCDSCTKEAYELAAEMWGLDLADNGFVFNEKTNTYEFGEDSEELSATPNPPLNELQPT